MDRTDGSTIVVWPGNGTRCLALSLLSLFVISSEYLRCSLRYLMHDAIFGYENLQLIYHIDRWLNGISLLIGGYLIDHWLGARVSLVLFQILQLLGTLVYALSVFAEIKVLSLLARWICTVTFDMLGLTQYIYIYRWFGDKYTNMSIGFLYPLSLIGNFASWNLIKWWDLHRKLTSLNEYEESTAFGIILLLLAAVMLVNLVIVYVLAALDERITLVRPRLSDGFKLHYKFSSTVWLTIGLSSIMIFVYLTLCYWHDWSLEVVDKNYDIKSYEYLRVILSIAGIIIGFMVDLVGYHLAWVLATIANSYVLLALRITAEANVPRLARSSFIGIGFSVVLTLLCGAIFKLVPEQQLGTALGIHQAGRHLLTILENYTVTPATSAYYLLSWPTLALALTLALMAKLKSLHLVKQQNNRYGVMEMTEMNETASI